MIQLGEQPLLGGEPLTARRRERRIAQDLYRGDAAKILALSARYTIPIPPSPSILTMRYGPNWSRTKGELSASSRR
jgi:hypothetical protein